MKVINIGVIISVLTITGTYTVNAQIHKHENRQETEIKIKEPVPKEPVQIKETEIEHKEVIPVVDHKEPIFHKEEEVKAETMPVQNTILENKPLQENSSVTNTPKARLIPRNYTMKQAIITPTKQITIPAVPQK